DYVEDEGNRVRTVEDFMDHLDPLLLSNYVLMEASRSRQRPSSVEFPRIILFRPDGRLVLGIATRPESEGYFDVEFLEFTRQNQWFLCAISFDRSRYPRPTHHFAGRDSGGGCTDCHGRSMRPIWGTYPDWAGAYGPGNGHTLSADQAATLTM